uniref:Uncharacterized protein, isoform C n=1 Tax=Drosophila melanogaster TaxID=7227 RepID=M9PHE1_DROME|nr:uncharacterized protein Dmel_CG2750, isoform C [Drosophila melanogaster]AGB95325.1 uncharacterized protein Dmel_CG2750, isoform C [Drosophila melanogaster]|eukprot:NP_001259482.1 uncharacterized protein Dmel_CG2750, isoform C [Drosophila melanogaster]
MSRDRGQQNGPNGSVECNNRPRSIQVARCPPSGVDLVSTPEHLRPGFRGRARRYNPNDFGLTDNEEWRHPRMFRDMTYETDAAAMETFRQAQPRRQAYETGINLSNLPEECLADMSAPGFDLSLPSQMSDLREEFLVDVSAPDMCDVSEGHVDAVYDEILDRLRRIRERMNRSNQLRRSDDCAMQQHQTHRRIYTRRDPSGHITSHVDETTISNAPSMDCTQANDGGEPGRHLNFSLPGRCENLMDQSMPSYHEASMPNECFEVMSSQDVLEDETMPSFENSYVFSRRQPTMPSECLEDVSQPSFERSRSRRQSPRRQLTMPSQNLCDISAPSFGDTTRDRSTNECLEDISMPTFEEEVSNVSRSRSPRRKKISRSARNTTDKVSSRRQTSECLDDMTMPSFGRSSSASPNRSRRQTQRLMTKSNINDISEPTYVSILRGPRTNECLDEITMPSFGAISNVSRGRTYRGQTMPSECLDDMTMPSFGGISRGKTPDRYQRSMPSRMTSECLDDMTMPSFGGISGSTRRHLTLPNARSSSQGSSRRQRTNIDDISAPFFAHSTKYGDTNECLENVSMPSYGGISGTSKMKQSRRQQLTMPSQNIGDISAPSFASSGRGNMTSECLEDISMPTFGEVSTKSRSKSLEGQQSARHRSMTNECLDDMTMPSMPGLSAASRRQMTLTNECLDDVSAPSFDQSVFRGSSRRQGRLSSPKPCASSTRCPPTNECLDDITMPSFDPVSLASAQRQMTMPSECLEDMSAPSFAGVSNLSRRQTTGLPSECLDDMSMPNFGNISEISRRTECEPAFRRSRSVGRSVRCNRSIGKSYSSSECLADVTMPSYGGNSYASRSKSTSRSRKSMLPIRDLSEMRTDECLEDVTMPFVGDLSGRSRASSPRQRSTTPRRGQFTSECLDDQTMPSFGGVSQSSGRRTPRRHTKNITNNTNECIENISMPSYVNNTRASNVETFKSMQGSRQGAMTNECLDEVTMPSFGTSSRFTATNECLEDISMPSYRDNTESLRHRCPTPIQSSRQECLDDMTMPSYGSTLPTLGETRRSTRGNGPRLEDISMPSYRDNTESLSHRCPTPIQSSRQECLDDMTMPSFGSTLPTLGETQRSTRGNGPRLEDISMPSYRDNTESLRHRCPTPIQSSRQECLDDMTMPSFGSTLPTLGETPRSTRGNGPRRIQSLRQRTLTNECLDDMTMPSFGRSYGGPATNECLEDISMPSCGENTGSSRGFSPMPLESTRRGASMVHRSRRGTMTNERLDDMTMPSLGSSEHGQATSECLEDISMPSYGANSGMSKRKCPTPPKRNTPNVTTECLNDMTMPSFGDPSHGNGFGECPESFRLITERKLQCPMTSENLDNMTMPSFGTLGQSQATNECLEDISMPSHIRNTNSIPGRSTTPRTLSRNEVTTNECLDDMTMPSYGNVFGSPGRQMTLPSECLNDVSQPPFVRSTSEETNRRHENLTSQSVDSRNPRPNQRSVTNECLEDMTMPTLFENSGSSRHGVLNSFRLEDISMPSGVSNRTQDSECVEVKVSGTHGGPTTSECLEDVSAPSFAPSSRMTSRHIPEMTNECLEDVSMPLNESSAMNDSKSIARRPPDISYPSEMLANESAPSYNSRQDKADKSADCHSKSPQQTARSRGRENCSGARLEDVTMPTFDDVSYQPRRHQLTMPTENLEDQTQPDFFNSTALPSSTRTEKQHAIKSPRQDHISISKQLADESAPTMLKDTTLITHSSTTSVTRVFQKTAETSNNSGHPRIDDLSMPQFESTGASSQQDISLHGFQSMDNYRPFDELIYSQNSVANETQPETPQPTRSINRSRSTRRVPSTPRTPRSPSTPNVRGDTSPNSSTRTPGQQPCDMVSTSYPYGKPQCYNRKPC